MLELNANSFYQCPITWWAAADPHRLSSSTFSGSCGCLEKESTNAAIRASPPPKTSTPLPRRPNQGFLYTSPLISSRSLLSPCVPTILTFLSVKPTSCVTTICLHMCLTAQAQESAACLQIASPSLHACMNFTDFPSLCLFQSQQQHEDFFRYTKGELCLLVEARLT